MRKRLKPAELEAIAPPVPAVEALRRNLLYAMFKAVKEDDMTAIVATQVEKAKDGDAKAARLIIDMVKAGEGNGSSQVYMQQVVSQPTPFLSDLRRMIVQVLASEGPLPSTAIAERVRVLLPDAVTALDHEWFDRASDGYHLTDQAKAEALEAGD